MTVKQSKPSMAAKKRTATAQAKFEREFIEQQQRQWIKDRAAMRVIGVARTVCDSALQAALSVYDAIDDDDNIPF